MEQQGDQFVAKLIDTFKIEAAEHLKSISDGLLALEGNPQHAKKQEIIETIFRDAHSLKGSARAVNHDAIQEICQSLESVLSDLRHHKIDLKKEQYDLLHETTDLIKTFISGQEVRPANAADKLQELTQKLSELRASDGPTPAQEVKEVEISPQNQPAAPEHIQQTTIRVSLHKLDTLMHEVEEMLILKLITQVRFKNLIEIQKHVYGWQKGWNKLQLELRKLRQAWEGEIKNYVPTKEFLQFLEMQNDSHKELGDKLNSMSKHAGQDARFVGTMVDNLLEDSKKILMLPFSSVFEILPRMVRDLSRSLNKNTSLILQGEDIEVDRRILEEMKDPLIHLIRNCIDHGLESSEIRKDLQKDPEGHLIVSATQTGGNSVEITIADDGKGIDVEKVKIAAINAGHLSEAEANTLPEEEALKLIFKSGVSTSSIITELSGRGLGMSIVMEKVEKLGGAIKVQTKKNIGTTFSISLPLTITTFRGLHIRAADHDFIFPTHNLLRVLRITPDQIHTIEGKESVSVYDKNLSYINLSDLLGIGNQVAETRKHIYILVVKVTDTIFAIGVDAILNEQEVLIKSLGKQLAKVRNIASATIMDEGKIIPILDPFDLKKSIQTTRGRSLKQEVAEEGRKRSVLIAEDSSTARLLLKNIFEGAGYDVKTAVNGADALTMIKAEIIDLLVSDVEMPRMDGFKLTEKLRANEDTKDLPIILCTSLGSQEDREHGIEVGANAYIDKSNFAQSNLLEIAKKLL